MSEDMKKTKSTGLTDWELGNDLLCNICDGMMRLSEECEETHPTVALKLKFIRLALGVDANELMGDSLAPSDDLANDKLVVTISKFLIERKERIPKTWIPKRIKPFQPY